MSEYGLLARLKKLCKRTPKNRSELSEMLQQACKDDLVDNNTLNMLEGVLDMQEMRVKDAMIPRLQMVTIENLPLQDIINSVVESGHSRYPVLGENKDEVIGIMLAKDLIMYSHSDKREQFNLRDILRPAKFIPESKRLNVLLQDFRLNRNHMAIVVDEYGRITGLITIEDVLERIVGDIEDEHDTDIVTNINLQADGSFLVKALTSMDEFNDYFDSAIEAQGSETIGGLVMRSMGKLPKRGETLDIDNFHISVVRADSRRLHLLNVKIVAAIPESSPQ